MMTNKERMARGVCLVRCKDCKHYAHSIYTETGFFCGLHSEGETYVTVDPDDFCSYGKNKNGAHVPLVISDTEAELIKRARSEMATKGEIGMDTTRAFLEARMTHINAWEEEHQKTK